MAEVLGRVTSRIAEQRGADALHRIRVPEPWIRRGETIEIDLPRNLTCAACEGGGCDVCDRAGATSLRGRRDPPESIEVTLPGQADVDPGSRVVLRIPGRGGLPTRPDVQERGLLLLRIEVAEKPDASVRLANPPRLSILQLTEDQSASPLLRLALLLALLLVLWVVAAVLLGIFG